ncbi:MAG: CBS domain-containing protein [Betaproteobacteria bacterium]|nr:CBS domain-containing protein [Betaproteobacteria bacterium]
MVDRIVSKSLAARHFANLLPTATVWEAAGVMTRTACSSVLIMDPSGTMLGIITERDLVTRVVSKALDPRTTPVTDVMTRNPQVVRPGTTVSQAVLIMIERGFRHLPVVGADGSIVGVFSARDALPREIDAAMTMAQFHEQINDALGGG